jgi:hypothetical protein
VLACAPSSSTGGVAPFIIGLEWHPGGILYVAYSNGDVEALDQQQRSIRKFFSPSSFRPAVLLSATIRGRELLFVSGFRGREGAILVWDSTVGQLIREIKTPELATGIGIDPGTTSPDSAPILYVASAVENVILAMNLNQAEPSFQTMARINEAGSLGPIVFDPVHKKLFVGDERTGDLYQVDYKTGEHVTAARNLGQPTSLVLDSDSGSLYVAEFRSQISVFAINQRGALSKTRAISVAPDWISAISLGPNNSLYVASFGRLRQISPKTGQEILMRNR